jgi:hypothetical protein
MVAGRVQSKKLDIERMGKPGQGMPVGLFKRGERPCNGAPVKTRAHMLVLDYIAVIVVTEESGMCGAAVERQSTRRQQQAKNRGALAARSGSIRHMIIESGFQLEASWIVGTKKKAQQFCWAIAGVKSLFGFVARCGRELLRLGNRPDRATG